MANPIVRKVCAFAAAACWTAAHGKEWNFDVLLDGAPIGTHRFVVEGSGQRVVRSDARYRVKVLGWTAYRYRHEATEQWAGDCLASVSARTDDNGSVAEVNRTFDAGMCTMSFAYWNPDIAAQRQLFDPGTGLLRAVRITPLAPAPIEVRGREVQARGMRIEGLEHPIELRYDGDNWVGLDTTVRGGRRLSYRLP